MFYTVFDIVAHCYVPLHVIRIENFSYLLHHHRHHVITLFIKIVAQSQKTIDQRHLIIAINSHDQNSIDIVDYVI